MGCFTLARAIFVRVLFTAHGLVAIWRLFMLSKEAQYWYLTTAIIGLACETAVTLYIKRGQEWKWFCPSVFFYLLCLVPTVWFLELHLLEERLNELYNSLNKTTSQPGLCWEMMTTAQQPITTETPVGDGETGDDEEEDIVILSDHVEGTLSKLSPHMWVKLIEQLLLLILILGRWLLPKGKLTHDQLSQLLLVYIGTAADIVEFFEAFNEQKVMHDRILCQIILAIWSWSVLQFTMVFTATKARKDQPGALSTPEPIQPSDSCCTPDVFGIIMSIFMQDGPFLVLRLLLIFKYGVISYTNMFFTCKNTLVCMLLLYRLVVIQLQRYHLMKLSEGGDVITMSESSSRAKLILSSSSTDQYYKYSTKVILRESSDDPNDVDITYIVKRHMSLPIDEDSVEDVRTLYASDGGILLPADIERLPAVTIDIDHTPSEGPAASSALPRLSWGASPGLGASGGMRALRRESDMDESRDILRRVSVLGRRPYQNDPAEMERQMVGSRVYSIESNSDNSVEASLNIFRTPSMKERRRVRRQLAEEAKKDRVTLSNALAKSIQAMNTAVGLHGLSASSHVGNSIGGSLVGGLAGVAAGLGGGLGVGLHNNSHKLSISVGGNAG